MKDEMLTRTERVMTAQNISEDDARLILTFRYFQLTRVEGIHEGIQDLMESFATDVCSWSSEKLKGFVELLHPINK